MNYTKFRALKILNKIGSLSSSDMEKIHPRIYYTTFIFIVDIYVQYIERSLLYYFIIIFL